MKAVYDWEAMLKGICKEKGWEEDKIDLKDYEVTYEGELDYPEMPDALEELFDIFNVRRPNDFKGRSMAVSDIVEVEGDNYYCDAVGWVKFK